MSRTVDLKLYGFVFLSAAVLLLSTISHAKSDESLAWKSYSTATAKWLWFDVYEASLYTSEGKMSDKAQFLADKIPLKLELCYLRELTDQQIIEAANSALVDSISSELAQAVESLHASYQNVGKGDCYSLEHNRNGVTQLSLNGNQVFETQLQGFKALYFGIWIGDQPLSEELKEDLLKQN
jgi:hypothetical protein